MIRTMSRSALFISPGGRLRRVRELAAAYLHPLLADFGGKIRPSTSILAALLVFVMAIGVRALYFDDLSKLPEEGNPMVPTGGPYMREAERVAEEGFIPTASDPRTHGMRLVHPPGYLLYLIALFKLMGWDNRPGVMALQVILDSLTAVLMVLLTAWMTNLRVGLLAGLLIAVSPHLGIVAVFVSPESLFVLPVVLAVGCLYLAGGRDHSIRYYLCAGLLLGIACWLRSNGLFLSPFLAVIAVVAARERKAAFTGALAMVLITVATIAPVTIRNYLISGRFIPLSIGLGSTLMTAVGDYDFDKKYGLPGVDPEIAKKEAEWYNRPDYAMHFLRPDGIERDNARVWRTLDVIARHPGFYLSTVVRRMEFMLRYDLPPGPDDWPFNTATPVYVSKYALFGHGPAGTLSGAEVLEIDANGLVERVRVAGTGHAALEEDSTGTTFAVLTPSPRNEKRLLKISSLEVNKRTDYVLSAEVAMDAGSAKVVVAGDPGSRELASNGIGSGSELSGEFRLPFASQENRRVSITLALDPPEQDSARLGIRSLRLIEVGPTPFGWSDSFRWAFRGLQRNLYRTPAMRLLWVIGLGALLLVGRWREALWIAAVPLYFLSFQSLLHTEYRYIITMHYFLFAFAAIGLYSLWQAASDAFNRVRLIRRA